MPLKVLVFDLDDTLFPERGYVESGFRAVDVHLRVRKGVVGFFAAAWQLFQQGVRGDTFDRALAALGVPHTPELVRELVEVYRSHEPTIAEFPETSWALAELRKSYQVGIVTDGFHAVQQRKIAALRLAERVDFLFFTDAFGREFWKPHRLVFYKVMEHTGLTGAEHAYIADNPAKDFLAPNELQWTTIRILRDEGEYCRVPVPDGGAPGLVFPSLRELVHYLRTAAADSPS